MRVLSEADVERLIDPLGAIEAAALAFRLQADGAAAGPARADLRREDPRAGCLLLAGGRGAELLAVKSNVHAYPKAPPGSPTPLRLWGSLLALWDWRRAEPRALLSARAFNEHRTAAGFAAAARALAAPNVDSLAVFGAGRSAPATALYLKLARPSLRRLFLQGRAPERVEALRALLADRAEFAGVELVTGVAPREAAAASGLVATVTTSDAPVFPGDAVPRGACVILGGANRPAAREADDALMRRADVYLDAREGALAKAGDLALALSSGALDPARIRGEIGAHLTGPAPLTPGSDVLVFKSMGLAIQDLVLAEHLVARAETSGLGATVDLEGRAA